MPCYTTVVENDECDESTFEDMGRARTMEQSINQIACMRALRTCVCVSLIVEARPLVRCRSGGSLPCHACNIDATELRANEHAGQSAMHHKRGK
jgi:hypothetical protein